jgi:hypothetical protein
VWREQGVVSRWKWPLRLGYRTFGNRFLLPALSLVCLAVVAFVDWQIIQALRNTGTNGALSPRQYIELYGWPFSLFMGACFGLMFLGVPAAGGIFCFRSWMDARQRRHQSIEATPEGTVWTDGSRVVASTWEQVRRVENAPANRTIIQTDNGDFDFTHNLNGWMLLLGQIRQHARNVPAEDWEPLWRERREPIYESGGLLFDYRNRSARLLAWCVTALLLLPVAAMALRAMTSRADPDFLKDGVPWPVMLVGVALVAWMWLAQQKAAIRIDERGITQIGVLGQRFVAWDDVRKYLQSETGFVVEGGAVEKRVVVRFQPWIGSLGSLLDEIEKRSHASQNTAWRHRLPPVGVVPAGER